MKVNPHNLVFDNIRDMQDIERDPDFIDLVASLEERVGQEMAPLSEIPTVYRMKDGKLIGVRCTWRITCPSRTRLHGRIL